MARKFKIDQGWTIYETSIQEILNWGGHGICDHCNETMLLGGFLVPVLNHCICEKCFEEWKPRATMHKEDLPIEAKNIEYYDDILELEDE